MAKYGEARPSADHSTAATSPATSAAWATSVNVDLRNVETLMKQEKTIDKHIQQITKMIKHWESWWSYS
jgi:hypothetical protein